MVDATGTALLQTLVEGVGKAVPLHEGFTMDATRTPNPARRVAPTRLDGWKSIAAHFDRDRTTVIRWARERALPVYRLPGGKTATVYALRDELDRWAGLTRIEEAQPTATSIETTVPRQNRGPSQRWIIHLAVVLVLGLTLAFLVAALTHEARSDDGPPALTMPADPTVARDFLVARDLSASRGALGLQEAITLLEKVVDASPDYAPGQASLAEALLLSREFGLRSDAVVFLRARAAARLAVRLAPDMAAGHRILGFIAYWADHDIEEAHISFRRALEIDPDDALSHLWYGNVLSDHGDHAAGFKALNRAQSLLPGSVAIGIDLAWARWSAGDDAAKETLQTIAQRYPDFVVAQDCLATIALVDGDLGGYVQHFDRFAMLRRDENLQHRSGALDSAQRRGSHALRAEIMAQALAEVAADESSTHIFPAIIASTAGDRASLRTILLRADRRKERWGQSGLTHRLAGAWRSDRELSNLIALRQSG